MRPLFKKQFFGLAPGPAGAVSIDPGKPWTGSRIENVYTDMEYWTNNAEWPNNSRFMDQALHPEWHEHMWSMSAGDKTEMTSEWLKVYAATYGGINYQISTAGAGAGFAIVKDGRYHPPQVAGGYTTNTDDWSVKYNAMRGFAWDYWTSGNPSNQHNFQIGSRPTAGGSSFGNLLLSVNRSNNYRWRVQVDDGEGNVTHNYLDGVPDCTNDSCALQWEFVKGSHIKFKMYVNVHNTLNFSTFTPPTWPIAESGYYVSVDLSGAGLNALTPITPVIYCGSSVETSTGRIGRFAYELRGIGNDWQYLV